MKNLYMLGYPHKSEYEVCLSFVICAESEQQAREIASNVPNYPVDMELLLDHEYASCEHIGTALEGIEIGVLQESYEAGYKE